MFFQTSYNKSALYHCRIKKKRLNLLFWKVCDSPEIGGFGSVTYYLADLPKNENYLTSCYCFKLD